MRKIASILLIFATLSATACGLVPEFDDGNSSVITDSGKKTTDSAKTTDPQVSDTDKPGVSATDTPDTEPSVSPDTKVPGGTVSGDYTTVPAAGDASLLSFHARTNPQSAEQIADCVGHYLPDVFTVSDAPKSLLDNVTAGLDGYALIGQPDCEGGSYQAIFYRESTVEAAKSATIWLTGTPAEQSKQEGTEGYDICTYALLCDKDSGRQFAVFQASLSSNAAARAEEIICLYAKYACYKDYFPTLLTGDLAGGDNSVLTAGGGLTKQADDLYTVCMECGVTDVKYGTYSSLTLGDTPYKLDLSKKLTALTFDDGPRIDSLEHAYTEAVLKTLAEYKRKATFFVIGNRLANPDHADLVRQEFAAGHEIGNHTYDHTSYTKISGDALIANLEQTDAKVRTLTGGIPTMVYRAPGGSNKTDAPLKRPLVNWSVDTEDWSASSTPDTVFEIFKKQIYAGGVVLMHDLHKNGPDALSTILTWLNDNGYQAVTVSELFEFSDIQMDSNHAYYSASRIKAR